MPDKIVAKIDVTKIDKARLFKGDKGTYLDVLLLPSKNNRYGDDYMVIQSVSKEEREAGNRGPIIGNAKILKSGERQALPAKSNDMPPDEDSDGRVPF